MPRADEPAGSEETAILRADGAIATITLNRPDRFNAIDVESAVTLRRIGERVAAMAEVRVVVINGAGRAFCAGGDIGLFAAKLDNLAPVVTELLGNYHAFLLALLTMPKLVVTSVHGAAAGAGLSLAFMGDFCIAGEDARFTPAYAKLGVSPDGGGTVGIAAAVGARRAMQIFLAEDGFSAHQGEAWGLVNNVVAAAALEAETRTLAERLAQNPPAAIAATKKLLRGELAAAAPAQLEAEMRHLVACMATDTFREAVQRFARRS